MTVSRIADLIARLRIAWRFKEWPWNVPAHVVEYRIGLGGPSQADIDRGEELAKEHGWL